MAMAMTMAIAVGCCHFRRHAHDNNVCAFSLRVRAVGRCVTLVCVGGMHDVGGSGVSCLTRRASDVRCAPPAHPPVHPPTRLPARLPACLRACVPACLPTCPHPSVPALLFARTHVAPPTQDALASLLPALVPLLVDMTKLQHDDPTLEGIDEDWTVPDDPAKPRMIAAGGRQFMFYRKLSPLDLDAERLAAVAAAASAAADGGGGDDDDNNNNNNNNNNQRKEDSFEAAVARAQERFVKDHDSEFFDDAPSDDEGHAMRQSHTFWVSASCCCCCCAARTRPCTHARASVPWQYLLMCCVHTHKHDQMPVLLSSCNLLTPFALTAAAAAAAAAALTHAHTHARAVPS